MRLLTKTSIHYLWVSGIVLICTLFLLFFILKNNIADEIREQLELQSELVMYEIKEGKHVEFPLVKIDTVSIHPAAEPVFKDTLIFDPLQQKKEDYYLLRQVKTINNKAYQITVATIYIGWQEYLETIGLVFLVLAIAITAGGALVNYFISKKVWAPFLMNLAKLKHFSFRYDDSVELISSDVNEFEELNGVLNQLMIQAKNEYHSLQEFTENASHELQTPISIIRSQLEKLSQHPMEQQSADLLQSAKDTLNRLSKVNRALLLLAKLERDNFPDLQITNVSDILEDLRTEFSDIFAEKEIKLSAQIFPVKLVCSPHLTRILFSNLLSNINHHTPTGGYAEITIDNTGIVFKNDGPPLNFPETALFQRFKKSNDSYKGTGLGLSIARQICVVHNWPLNYSYEHGQHIFRISFCSNT
ncbi:sensor histidine kinase [Mucilaginibacter conchicola]|uniref:histidine kinase n=1 Tax=Mucilaginibacter conchicola TaxID=2303333 RepID=A0A372NNK1_9SPHI|nr:HAMP domain-containing sensor histidine kinase [Mucilaginibacter conchicola]RFZ89965.1 sensor histidine kinase [Mucilaginibacter conchicola]